jgi:uncharacterized oxidoreductase
MVEQGGKVMKMSENTILITGGASGIGLALAERFLNEGNEVIICGRRESKLQEAKEKFPSLHTKVCDVSIEESRIELVKWATESFPKLNVIVNNAGIQQRVNLLHMHEEWPYYEKELMSNVSAPIHLTSLLIPHFVQQERAAVINVTSGLSLTPGAWVPIYSATKAALRSFTISLRHQVEETNTEVIEILPPAVNTDLGGPGLHTFGAPLDDFADSIFEELKKGKIEIGYGDSAKRLHASKEEIEKATAQAWNGFLKNNPEF